jgi:hypothetical protein
MSPTSPQSDAAAVAWPPSEFTLKLRRPILDEAGGEIADLRLHEPTDDEWVKIMKHPAETRRRFLIATIAKITEGSAARLALGDAVQAENYCLAFFELGEATTPWSQPNSPTSTAGTLPSSEG